MFKLSTKLLTLLSAMIAVVSISFGAQAGEKSFTGLIGFSQSALGFGANFENRHSQNFGVGAYFLHSSENKNAGKHQVISFGGMLPVHMVDTYDLDLYLAPGFGIHMIKGLNNGASGEDQTTFGPMWKIGFLYKVSSNVRIGLEQSQIVNWFSEKSYSQFTYTNFAANFIF